MKAKLVFIEVEESRLRRTVYDTFCLHHEAMPKDNICTPIKPVLVGEGEIKEGDEVVVTNVSNGYRAIKTHRGKVSPLSSPRQKILTQDTEELYEQIAKGELVEGEWYHFDSSYRKEAWEDTGITKLDRPLRGCQWRAPLINFNPEPNEVTEKEEIITRTKEQTEAIITALTKLSEKFYADMDRIVNGEIYEPDEVTEEEIESKLEELQDEAHQNNIGTNEAELEVRQRFAEWAIERMNKPPQDTTSQESKDYWKKHYNN